MDVSWQRWENQLCSRDPDGCSTVGNNVLLKILPKYLLLTYIRYHGQVKGGRHATFVYASFLGANIGGHLLRPQCRRLTDADHLLTVSFGHDELKGMTPIPESSGIHLLHRQRDGAGYGETGSVVVQVSRPPLRGREVTQREDLSMSRPVVAKSEQKEEQEQWMQQS